MPTHAFTEVSIRLFTLPSHCLCLPSVVHCVCVLCTGEYNYRFVPTRAFTEYIVSASFAQSAILKRARTVSYPYLRSFIDCSDIRPIRQVMSVGLVLVPGPYWSLGGCGIPPRASTAAYHVHVFRLLLAKLTAERLSSISGMGCVVYTHRPGTPQPKRPC